MNENETPRMAEIRAALESMHQSEAAGLSAAADDQADLLERFKGALVAHTKACSVYLGLMASLSEKDDDGIIETARTLGQYIAAHAITTRDGADFLSTVDEEVRKTLYRDMVGKGKQDAKPN